MEGNNRPVESSASRSGLPGTSSASSEELREEVRQLHAVIGIYQEIERRLRLALRSQCAACPRRRTEDSLA